MPELPEVYTVKEALKANIINKVIESIDVKYEKILANIDPISFNNALKGAKLSDLKTYGKQLIFVFDKGYIVSSLRMEGKYKYNVNLDKHSHIIFNFQDKDVLIYHDVRKFGRMYFYPSNTDIYKEYPLNTLGLEPWFANIDYLKDKLKKDIRPIKEVLLDQSILAGIGNIYADEILYASLINPLKKACTLSNEMLKSILDNSISILTKAKEMGGSTIKSFQSQHGVDGRFQQFLNAYHQETCKKCNSKIDVTKVGGRSTHFCPNCQRKYPFVGLTGQIGSGKSYIGSLFKKYGYEVVDTDFITKISYFNDNIKEKLQDAFGCVENGVVNKNILKSKLNDSNIDLLNSIIHPFVRDIIDIYKDHKNPVLIEVPLLFETHFENEFDSIIAIDITDKKRHEYLQERMDNKTIYYLESKQLKTKDKIKKANYIIDKNQDDYSIEKQVKNIIDLLNKS